MGNSTQMSVKERIFHSFLFEIGAIGAATVVVIAFSAADTNSALGVSVMMSIMAMLWHFLFNLGFDKIFTAPRENRGLGLRIFHTVSFEIGLLIFTLPIIAYMLNLNWWQALVADIGLTVVIMIYGLIFNWIYDNLRLKFI